MVENPKIRIYEPNFELYKAVVLLLVNEIPDLDPNKDIAWFDSFNEEEYLGVVGQNSPFLINTSTRLVDEAEQLERIKKVEQFARQIGAEVIGYETISSIHNPESLEIIPNPDKLCSRVRQALGA